MLLYMTMLYTGLRTTAFCCYLLTQSLLGTWSERSSKSQLLVTDVHHSQSMLQGNKCRITLTVYLNDNRVNAHHIFEQMFHSWCPSGSSLRSNFIEGDWLNMSKTQLIIHMVTISKNQHLQNPLVKFYTLQGFVVLGPNRKVCPKTK